MNRPQNNNRKSSTGNLSSSSDLGSKSAKIKKHTSQKIKLKSFINAFSSSVSSGEWTTLSSEKDWAFLDVKSHFSPEFFTSSIRIRMGRLPSMIIFCTSIQSWMEVMCKKPDSVGCCWPKEKVNSNSKNLLMSFNKSPSFGTH